MPRCGAVRALMSREPEIGLREMGGRRMVWEDEFKRDCKNGSTSILILPTVVSVMMEVLGTYRLSGLCFEFCIFLQQKNWNSGSWFV